jgi:hypothetical protein
MSRFRIPWFDSAYSHFFILTNIHNGKIKFIPERFTTVNLEGFYGTYEPKVFIGPHVTSLRLLIGSRAGEKGFHWSASWVVGGPDSVRNFQFFK